MTEAIKNADIQIGRVWNAVKERMEKTGEKWMVVVTTDHGRDAKTGKSHGGQSDRERTTWIATNQKPLNAHFDEQPAMVDIMPSILRFMDIQIPSFVKEEMDGVPFIGQVSISHLKAEVVKDNNKAINLTWNVLIPGGEVEIWISTTNGFKDGKTDQYQLIGKTNVSSEKFSIDISRMKSKFIKVLVKAPYNWENRWVNL